MSVIPLIIDGEDRTVVETREDFEAAGGLAGNVVFIQTLDRDQLLSEDDTNVSYDLRIGQVYRDHRDVGSTDLRHDGVIKLLPGGAVIVETEEVVHFPKSRFGQIVPKVSFLQKGVSNTASKVDPGYSGHLLITVFNLGKKKITLRRGQRFCSLYILQVDEGVRPYNKPEKRIVGDSKRNLFRRARDFLETNIALIMVLVIIVTLLKIIADLF